MANCATVARARIPTGPAWRTGTVSAVDNDPPGCRVVVDGRSERFDAVLGCDGYRSVVRWAELVRLTRLEGLSVQPVYDLVPARVAAGRCFLVGDAGSVARPRTGLGATKAIQDAIALERACTRHDDWTAAVVASYDRARRGQGVAAVALGQRLGRATVEQTPLWSTMGHDDFERWWRHTVVGEQP